MTDAKKKSKVKREYEKPVSFSPLAFEEAVAGLLQTPPPKEKVKPKQSRKKKKPTIS